MSRSPRRCSTRTAVRPDHYVINDIGWAGRQGVCRSHPNQRAGRTVSADPRKTNAQGGEQGVAGVSAAAAGEMPPEPTARSLRVRPKCASMRRSTGCRSQSRQRFLCPRSSRPRRNDARYQTGRKLRPQVARVEVLADQRQAGLTRNAGGRLVPSRHLV